MNLQVVGKSLPRVDAVAKATGRADYVADMALPGMLFGKILRSPYPHARLVHIDVSKAKRLSGVRAVVTGKDVPRHRYGIWPDIPFTNDQVGLAVDKVRYLGEEVAALAAVDEDTAQEALQLMEVEYEQLAAVFNPQDAMEPAAPQIHEVEKNIAWPISFNFGDVEQGFRESDYVQEDTFITHHQCHSTIETHVSLARFDPPNRYTLWTSTQSLDTTRGELATSLGVPLSDIRIIKAHVGGGFGCKTRMYAAHFLSAVLAKASGRPVKIVYDREEQFIATLERHAFSLKLTTGVKKDGTLVAKECTAIADGGAYNSHGPVIIGRAGAQLSLIYRVPNMRYTGYLVYTNKPVCGAFRGFGNLQARFADESQMDMIAYQLGIDPVEIRLKNAMQPDHTTPHRWRVTSCGLSQAIDSAAQGANWRQRRGKMPKGQGLGIACGGYISGTYVRHNAAGAFIKVEEDGGVTVIAGASDVGQGSDTVLCQIAAEELGISLEKVKMTFGDSDVTPLDLGSFSSRITFVVGNAVKAAAQDVKRQLLQVVAETLEANVEDLEAERGRMYVRGTPDRGLSFADAVKTSLKKGRPVLGRGSYNPDYCEPLERETGAGNISPAYSFGAMTVEIEVDEETGQVRFVNAVSAFDCGRAINPCLVEGQMEGSVVMGQGWAFTEEVYRDKGQSLNASLLDYRIPTALDIPEISSVIVEPVDPNGPFGAKGMSEGTMLPVAPALANAIFEATGVRMKELPFTPDRLLAGLERKKRRRDQ